MICRCRFCYANHHSGLPLVLHKACPWNANYQVLLAKLNEQSEFCIRLQLRVSFLLEFLIPCQELQSWTCCITENQPKHYNVFKTKAKVQGFGHHQTSQAKSKLRPL